MRVATWEAGNGAICVAELGVDYPRARKTRGGHDSCTGTYGNARQFTLKGTAAGKKLTFEYQEGQAAGNAQRTLDESGQSFRGIPPARTRR